MPNTQAEPHDENAATIVAKVESLAKKKCMNKAYRWKQKPLHDEYVAHGKQTDQSSRRTIIGGYGAQG